MKKLLLAAPALALFAAPQAHAQLLGSGSIGGLGGIAGSVTGATGPMIDRTTTTSRTATRTKARGDASTRGNQRVDRRSGSVALDRSLDGGAAASTSQLLDTPAGSASGSAAGNGRASGAGSASAQLVGTDAVRGVAGEATGRARDTAASARSLAGSTAGAARDRASGLAGNAGSLAGSASGNASSAGSAAGSLGGTMLAVAGSGAAAGDGAFAVAPGMPVMAPDGQRLGKVREVVGDARGRVQQVIVEARGQQLAIPAGDLAASGNALVMGEGAASASQAVPSAE